MTLASGLRLALIRTFFVGAWLTLTLLGLVADRHTVLILVGMTLGGIAAPATLVEALASRWPLSLRRDVTTGVIAAGATFVIAILASFQVVYFHEVVLKSHDPWRGLADLRQWHDELVRDVWILNMFWLVAAPFAPMTATRLARLRLRWQLAWTVALTTLMAGPSAHMCEQHLPLWTGAGAVAILALSLLPLALAAADRVERRFFTSEPAAAEPG